MGETVWRPVPCPHEAPPRRLMRSTFAHPFVRLPAIHRRLESWSIGSLAPPTSPALPPALPPPASRWRQLPTPRPAGPATLSSNQRKRLHEVKSNAEDGHAWARVRFAARGQGAPLGRDVQVGGMRRARASKMKARGQKCNMGERIKLPKRVGVCGAPGQGWRRRKGPHQPEQTERAYARGHTNTHETLGARAEGLSSGKATLQSA